MVITVPEGEWRKKKRYDKNNDNDDDITWHDIHNISDHFFSVSYYSGKKESDIYNNNNNNNTVIPVVTKYVYEYEKYIVMVRKNKQTYLLLWMMQNTQVHKTNY